MSLESLNREEKCSLHLDSDSSWDKKSLAKSISISELDIIKPEELHEKELENLINSKIPIINSDNIDEIYDQTQKEIKLENILTKPEESGIEDSNDKSTALNENSNTIINYAAFKNNIDKNEININNSVDKNFPKNKNIRSIKKDIAAPLSQVELTKLSFFHLITQRIDGIDKFLSAGIQDLQLKRNMECLIYLFARLFNPDFIASYFVVILSYKSYNSEYFFVIKPVISTVICISVTLLLKKYIRRIRPERSKKSRRIIDLRRNQKGFSMPCEDSIQAGNFAAIMSVYFNSQIGFFVIPFVMLARVYFYCQYLSDTIVGALLGVFISTILNNIIY